MVLMRWDWMVTRNWRIWPSWRQQTCFIQILINKITKILLNASNNNLLTTPPKRWSSKTITTYKSKKNKNLHPPIALKKGPLGSESENPIKKALAINKKAILSIWMDILKHLISKWSIIRPLWKVEAMKMRSIKMNRLFRTLNRRCHLSMNRRMKTMFRDNQNSHYLAKMLKRSYKLWKWSIT